ncbi:MAG: hypothetical protein JWN94_1912 [Betaproteobacteria bacterium]|nr:hypothetical protein [Betaproteobacteria bacterium]
MVVTQCNISEGTENAPHPFALVEAMRSIGYTPPTALADLIDNGITAGAKNIKIRMSPPRTSTPSGFVVVEDDGNGMSPERLAEAMRWGGDGPDRPRRVDDLGRFGLGMKTASIALGRRLTVASRAAGEPLRILRWDLDHIAQAGWKMLDGPDAEAEPLMARSALFTEPTATGTIVIVTYLDRLAVRSSLPSHSERNEAALTAKIAEHLGMVFHRFIAEGLKIRLGASEISGWDPFKNAVLKDTEKLGGAVEVASYVLPHHSTVTTEEDSRMAGPSGWGAHQGFLVYRARRLIVPGGWLRLFSPAENCRLARIRIDLPNMLDDGWKLNVMKSSVVPPSWQLADLQRIGEATRRESMAMFNFRGERQAPTTGSDDSSVPNAFWMQVPSPDAVRFRINRAHAVVQTLKQSVRDPAVAEDFLRAFERMLPLQAILQDPKRTVNGAVDEPTPDELRGMAEFAKKAVKTLRAQGYATDAACRIVLCSEPFALYAEKIRPHLI